MSVVQTGYAAYICQHFFPICFFLLMEVFLDSATHYCIVCICTKCRVCDVCVLFVFRSCSTFAVVSRRTLHYIQLFCDNTKYDTELTVKRPGCHLGSRVILLLTEHHYHILSASQNTQIKAMIPCEENLLHCQIHLLWISRRCM